MEAENSPENTEEPEEGSSKIFPTIVEDEMKKAYLDYSMSVIVGRALPDVRDGLKPVHRRVLYSMLDLGLLSNKPFKKSARVVGDCLGKYHPHGDTAVYDSLVRMAQSFSLRYPLVIGQGNFGSVDGDSAAAMRYCITGDSLILTDKGLLSIKNISNKSEARIKMKILSYNNKKNSASKFFNSGKHNILNIETKLGYKIRGSYNHPVMCWTFKNNLPQIEWKLLENIKKNDFVLINRNSSLFSKTDMKLKQFHPKLNNKSKKINLPSAMNKELAFLLGALVSEGSFHQNKIIFNNSDAVFYNKVKEAIYNQFGEVNLNERKIKGNCFEFDLYLKQVVKFLINIGLEEVKSAKKSIPFSILQSSKKIVVAFLQGLFEGDGSVKYKIDKRHNGKSIELTYNSKSVKLIDQLKILLLNFGIVTTKPCEDKRNRCYKLIILGFDSIKKFKDEINFFSERKKDSLSNIDSLNSSRMSKTDYIPYLNEYLRSKYKKQFILKNNFNRYNNLEKNYKVLINIIESKDKQLIDFILKGKYLFNKISKIDSLKKKEEVFSIKVDSRCHSFIANGFINHNTESKMSKIAEEMLEDIKKDTVDFMPNFDNSLQEPTVLPSKIPNLLVNGSSGIAVGMATNIPPHNMTEVCDAIVFLIDNPEANTAELMQYIKGPDFPTAGIIMGRAGIRSAYETGRGKVLVRGRTDVEETKKGRERIVITEIPYQLNKTLLIEQIASLVNAGTISGVSDLRDESDKEGMRIVIELKQDANSQITLNQLYKHTRLESTFGIIMLSLVDNQPMVLNLKDTLTKFIDHRRIVIRRRTSFDLKKAEERAHILEGLIIALDHIDEVVQKIKQSKTAENAKTTLMQDYSLTELQAKAILDMKLQKLSSLEQENIRTEHKDLLELIKDLKEILADEQKILGIVKKEIREVKDNYGDERRTEISDAVEAEIEIEDLIEEEEVVVTITQAGYIKRLPLATYKSQGRGGRGVVGTGKKDDDFVKDLFTSSTHSYVLFFTDKGQVYWLKVYQIPEGSRQAKGKPIINLINLRKDEKISASIPVKEFDDQHFLFMATQKGTVKKTPLNEFSRPRSSGIRAITFRDGDKLIDVLKTDGNADVLLATREGMAIRFKESNVRPMGRTAAGVRGITLKKADDRIVGLVKAEDERTLLTITENGYGKRTPMSEYRVIGRGGKGVINIQCSARNGKVVDVLSVNGDDEVMFISQKGIIIRTATKGISKIGRNTQGVRLMKLQNDKVSAAAKIIQE